MPEQKHKKAHHAGEDKAKEKEMPPWWRLNEDYFRELRSGDLARVVPPGGWLAEDDPDLLAPPCGRPATRAGGAEEGTWWRDGTAVSAPSAPSAPATVPGAIASAIVTAPVSPPYVPYIAPKPTGVSVGDDLLDTTLVAEDLAVLARAELLFSELPRKKDVARLASKEFCDVDEKFLEDWLAGVGKCKRREDGDGTCKGVARWLRHRAATSQMDAARELREAQTPPEPAGTAKKQQSGDGPDATALAQSPYKPPAPTVVAIIKTNDDGTVYVGGEEPAKAAAAAAAANAAGAGGIGGVLTGAAAVAARALGLGRTASFVSNASNGSLSTLPSASTLVLPGADASGKGANAAALSPQTEDEKAEAEHRRLVRTAFGHQGSLPHLHGPCRVDEAMLPHTALLLDRSFWLTSSVSKLPKAPPPTPWISPSPPKLREVVSSRASQQGKKGGVKGGGHPGGGRGEGNNGNSGRCSVCVVQKKGRCGTDTAPRNCLRRAGAMNRFKRDEDDEDESEPDPFDASPVEAIKAEMTPVMVGAGGADGQGAVQALPPAKPKPKWMTPPAASTAAIAEMRREEQRRRREEEKKRRAANGGDAEGGGADGLDSESEPESSEDEGSSSESESEIRSARAELDALTKSLDGRPELRAAAPVDEVESELLALQYELLWQTQANRSVLSAVLKRVGEACETEGKNFATVEGEAAEANQMMSKVREVRRMLKREKREADQRAALERAAAAAASSSRVGAQRRDADGNVIAPVMGALDGLPPDIVAAAMGRAEEEAKTRATRERERKEASETAILAARLAKEAAEAYRPPPPMVGRFGAPANSAQQAHAKAAVAQAAGGSSRAQGGGSSLPATPVNPNHAAFNSVQHVQHVQPSSSPVISAAPAVLVDTVHAAAEHGPTRGPGECAVCAGTADQAFTAETMRCARCALPVHPRCYGLKSGQSDNAESWMCWCCQDATNKGKANTPAVLAAARTAPPGSIKPSSQEKMAMYRGVSCILCPVQLGAFKQTGDGRWCHVVCAQWQPEVVVRDADEMQCFKGIAQIPKERATQPCCACGQRAGVTMRCSYGHCQATFHPLCARQSGFHVRASDGGKPQFRAYCDKHSQTQRERDEARGVPPAVVPPPPELGPVTVARPTFNAAALTNLNADPGNTNQTPGHAGASTVPIASPSPGGGGGEDPGSTIRRLRSDLQRARAHGSVGGAGGSKRKGGMGGGEGFSGADSGTASDAEGFGAIGPSGVVPTAPKRARTGSAKQLKESAALAGVGDGAAGAAAQPKKRGRPRKVQPDGGPASAATKPAN